MQEVEDRRREFRDELAMKGGVARRRDLANAQGEILPDAGNLAEARFVQLRELVWVIRRNVGAVAVRANLERVVVLDFQEVGDFPENAGDRGVIQAGGPRFRSDTRAGARRQRRAPTPSPVWTPARRSRTDSRPRPRRRAWRRSHPRLSRPR